MENKKTYDYDYKDVEQFLDFVSEDICGKNNTQIKIQDNQYTISGNDKTFSVEIFELDSRIDVVYKEIVELSVL